MSWYLVGIGFTITYIFVSAVFFFLTLGSRKTSGSGRWYDYIFVPGIYICMFILSPRKLINYWKLRKVKGNK